MPLVFILAPYLTLWILGFGAMTLPQSFGCFCYAQLGFSGTDAWL